MHECQEIRSANINQKEDRFLIYERDLLIKIKIKTITNSHFKNYFNQHLIFKIAFIIIYMLINNSVHDKFHRTLILSGFCLLKIAKISLNSSFFPKPIKR
ncbi:hypothetical protein CAS80_05460 [Acinetobacter baumannii]|nr:hypothetical protein CAS80_05460 [Acinetobacter baumannii]TMS56089.1 hypothetical protein FGQ54_01950 [Acinetobacter lwoffii]